MPPQGTQCSPARQRRIDGQRFRRLLDNNRRGNSPRKAMDDTITLLLVASNCERPRHDRTKKLLFTRNSRVDYNVYVCTYTSAQSVPFVHLRYGIAAHETCVWYESRRKQSRKTSPLGILCSACSVKESRACVLTSGLRPCSSE